VETLESNETTTHERTVHTEETTTLSNWTESDVTEILEDPTASPERKRPDPTPEASSRSGGCRPSSTYAGEYMQQLTNVPLKK